MKRRIAGLVSIAVVIAAAGLLAAPPASAATYDVSGTQVYPGSQEDSFGMQGSLTGDLWVTEWIPRTLPSGATTAHGTEWFYGCLNGFTCGWLELRFRYAGAPGGIPGGCVHWIVSGTDGFAGASGVIAMADSPAGTTYSGFVRL